MSDGERRARGAELFRVMAEVERDDPSGLRHVRLRDSSTWVCASEQYVAVLRRLGEAADELASRPVLISPGEVAHALTLVAECTGLAHLPSQKLAELEAAAGENVALSARLELYPRGMEPALALSMSALRGELTPDEVRKRVALRYPDAAPLPPPPELHELLAAQGLQWQEGRGVYGRPGELGPTTMGSRHQRIQEAREPISSDEPGLCTRSNGSRGGSSSSMSCCVASSTSLGVNAERAWEAALELSKRLGAPVAFDQRLAAAIHDRMRARKQCGLAPWECSKQPDSAAILLLVPSVDSGGIPAINGELVIPGIMKSQALWVSRDWLANKHNEPA